MKAKLIKVDAGWILIVYNKIFSPEELDADGCLILKTFKSE